MTRRLREPKVREQKREREMTGEVFFQGSAAAVATLFVLICFFWSHMLLPLMPMVTQPEMNPLPPYIMFGSLGQHKLGYDSRALGE
jgi:hypothetical protein